VIERDADAKAVPFVVIARALRMHCPFLNPAVLKLSVTGETDRSEGAADGEAPGMVCVATTVSVPAQFSSRSTLVRLRVALSTARTTSSWPEMLLKSAAFPF